MYLPQGVRAGGNVRPSVLGKLSLKSAIVITSEEQGDDSPLSQGLEIGLEGE